MEYIYFESRRTWCGKTPDAKDPGWPFPKIYPFPRRCTGIQFNLFSFSLRPSLYMLIVLMLPTFGAQVCHSTSTAYLHRYHHQEHVHEIFLRRKMKGGPLEEHTKWWKTSAAACLHTPCTYVKSYVSAVSPISCSRSIPRSIHPSNTLSISR